MGNYHFGVATFERQLWINGGAVFRRPTNVDVEFTTSGAFDWVLRDSGGREVRTVRHDNPSAGWTGIDLASLGLFADYSIGFRNASGGVKRIKQGDVRFDGA